jgi:hypothetical protein
MILQEETEETEKEWQSDTLSSFAMGPILRCLLGLGWVVAASVSEWMSLHSLTLAATSEMKKMPRGSLL